MEETTILANVLETKLNLNVDRHTEEKLPDILEVQDADIRLERDPQTDQKIINGYRIEEEIGKGSWGKVKACQDMRTGKKMAIKKFHQMILKKKTKITKDEQGNVVYKSQWDNVEQEIGIMKQCSHPNVVQIQAILHDDSQSKLYIILDYCELGDMLKWNEKTLRFSHISNPKTAQIKSLQRFMLDACLALKYLHEKDIIHRDIKPQNILVTHDFKAKLCDFGLAMKLNFPQQTIRGTEGTYHFMAPESLSDSDTKSGYDGKKADIWSLGVTFYCMFYLRLPFYHDNLMNLFNTIQAKEPKYDLKMWCQSPFLIELLQKMLIKDPKKRIELNDIITHPFFKETGSS